MTNSERHTDKLQVFSTTTGEALTRKICDFLAIEPGRAEIKRFNDGEVSVQLLDEVRDNDVFIVAPTQPPAENFIEAIHLCEAVRSSSAKRVTYVIPYMGYSRADRKDAERKLIAVRIAFEMLELAQPDRFIILDIHAEQTLACVRHAVVDHVYGSSVAVAPLKEHLGARPFVIAAPDNGATPRAHKYAQLLGHEDFVVFSKTRTSAGRVDERLTKIIGEVEGRVVVFIDDMIDTAGTIIANAKAAKAAGATAVLVFATHALFSNNALQKIKESAIEQVLTTDSVPHDAERLKKESGNKVMVLTVAELLGQAIKNSHEGQSVSKLNRA